MKFLSSIAPLAVLMVTVSSLPLSRRDLDESLIPQFGFVSGVNPTGMIFRLTELRKRVQPDP